MQIIIETTLRFGRDKKKEIPAKATKLALDTIDLLLFGPNDILFPIECISWGWSGSIRELKGIIVIALKVKAHQTLAREIRFDLNKSSATSASLAARLRHTIRNL